MRTTITSLLFFVSLLTRAQSAAPDVIATSGDYFSNASYSLAWTLGESMGETYSSTNNFLTQGFNQPDYGTLTFVEDLNPGINIIAFPNPVIHNLSISFGNSKGSYSLKVFDAIGNLLRTESILADGTTSLVIPFSNYSSGVYLIQIINANTFSKSSYTIIKVGQ